MKKRKSGERVKAKIWCNADVEEVVPPPLIIRPFLDYWDKEVIRTEEEKESKPVHIGSYQNLRDARHKQNRKTLSKKTVIEWYVTYIYILVLKKFFALIC